MKSCVLFVTGSCSGFANSFNTLQAFAQLLQAPQDDAQIIIRERFPVPRLVVCDQHGSQVSACIMLFPYPEIPFVPSVADVYHFHNILGETCFINPFCLVGLDFLDGNLSGFH